ncbi:MAG: hypothetical protein WC627_13235, partial [Legionella sp.]
MTENNIPTINIIFSISLTLNLDINRACLQFNFLRPAACPRDPVGSGFMQQDFALFKISGSR